MSNVAAGTTWNLPNYWGNLFTSDVVEFPITNMIGGLSGAKKSDNFEFPTAQLYSQEAVSQPAITETDSLTAPAAISYVRSQEKNVCQIFQEQVSISYERLANQGRLSGINTAGAVVNPMSEEDWQISKAMEKISRDLEHTILNGAYQIATDAGTANKTAGLLEVCTTKTNASSADLSKELIDTHLAAMFAAGAMFKRPVFVGNSFQIGKLNDIYGYTPADWNIGGVKLSIIRTMYGDIGVLNPHRFMTTSILGVFDMSVVSLVFQEVPGKGLLFYEKLAKTGAGEAGQIFGKIGLDHGPKFAHGQIYGLSTS
jgi:hypothetical protein